MVVAIGVELKVATFAEITLLSLVRHLAVIMVARLQYNQLLPLLVENGEVDVLIAEKRQLHRLLDEAFLPFAVGHVPVVIVLDLYE